MVSEYVFTETIGLIAAFCTTFAFIPQVVQLYKTRVTTGISLGMYLIFTTGVFMWLIYGIILSSPSLIIVYSLTYILGLSVLVMKWMWK